MQHVPLLLERVLFGDDGGTLFTTGGSCAKLRDMKSETYSGRCHCGAVRFRFRSEPIAAGKRCNCSICVRKGAVLSVAYVPPEDIEELVGLDGLSVYRWGDADVNHYFCRTCGIYPFHDATDRPGHYRFNLGCIDGLDVLALPVDILDGRSFPIRGES